MKSVLVSSFVSVIALAVSSSAFADGFVCRTTDGVLVVKAYNHVQPELGTRNAAIMILSDQTIQAGNKTIATLSDAQGLLTNRAAQYRGKVDLRFATSNLGGRNIGGTKLMYVDSVYLTVDFNYAQPIGANERTSGQIVLKKRDGSVLRHDVECVRYLKNS